MPKTRRRRSRRGGKKWWQFWKKKIKSNPAPINMQGNAVRVEREPGMPTSHHDPLDMEKPSQRDIYMDKLTYSEAVRASLNRPAFSSMDARAGETSNLHKTRRARRASNTQNGRGRFRKRRRSRRRRSRRRRRRRSRRKRH